MTRQRIWVRKGWLFWQAWCPDESLGTLDSHTVIRSLSREGVIAKAEKRWIWTEPDHEEVWIGEEA